MTGPLRPCGNPRCHLCNASPQEGETLAEAALAGAALALFVMGFLLLLVAMA